MCNHDDFELQGKLLCKWICARSIAILLLCLDYKLSLSKKSVSTALNQEFALERSENDAPNEFGDYWSMMEEMEAII